MVKIKWLGETLKIGDKTYEGKDEPIIEISDEKLEHYKKVLRGPGSKKPQFVIVGKELTRKPIKEILEKKDGDVNISPRDVLESSKKRSRTKRTNK